MIITIKEKINCRFYDAEYMIICKSEQSPLFFSFPTHCYVSSKCLFITRPSHKNQSLNRKA